MRQGKLVFAVMLLVAAMLGGLYLAGWLTLWLLNLKSSLLAWNTWWQYLQATNLPQYVPYAGKIKLAGGFGFGLPLLAWLLLLIPLSRRKVESLHGDARFASLSDLRKAGLLTQSAQGILIGKYRGRYLWLNGAQHAIAISPTRSGKTTSIAIPVLLSYAQSMMVLDLKGELFKATSGWREAQGHVIRVWAPYDDAGNTHRFNPMSLMAGMDPGKRLGELQTMAAILYPDEAGKDPFWTSQSRATFAAFASFMFEIWDAQVLAQQRAGTPASMQLDPNTSILFPSLERILRLSSGMDGKGIKETLQQILADP
ncbi:MAG TPA: type IV secretory system conjugative DNA transfer family protein, partial [Candidatus Acidoferrales bacterium]|nr:type IV secretory system conjugative DNA transfer family protein [Candidatus Acidoferrales bacterium]